LFEIKALIAYKFKLFFDILQADKKFENKSLDLKSNFFADICNFLRGLSVIHATRTKTVNDFKGIQ